MDEFYSLVERHQDGRPDMIGMEAVNQLLVALEVHRFDFCFIGAGYEREVDEFLHGEPGSGGPVQPQTAVRVLFAAELAEIAIRYGRRAPPFVEPAAAEALKAACTTLRAYHAPDGTHGVDVMQNGRFARNVVERAERLRDSRVAAQHRTDKGSVDGRRPADAAQHRRQRCGERRVRGKACADGTLTPSAPKTPTCGPRPIEIS